MSYVIDVHSQKKDGFERRFVPEAVRSSLLNAKAYINVNRLAWRSWMQDDDCQLVARIRNKRSGNLVWTEWMARPEEKTNGYYERGIT